MSAGTTIGSPSIADATSSRRSRPRAMRPSRAPRAARALAVARPIPLEAPVTMARVPGSIRTGASFHLI
jgi:hypothetical protein